MCACVYVNGGWGAQLHTNAHKTQKFQCNTILIQHCNFLHHACVFDSTPLDSARLDSTRLDSARLSSQAPPYRRAGPLTGNSISYHIVHGCHGRNDEMGDVILSHRSLFEQLVGMMNDEQCSDRQGWAVHSQMSKMLQVSFCISLNCINTLSLVVTRTQGQSS